MDKNTEKIKLNTNEKNKIMKNKIIIKQVETCIILRIFNCKMTYFAFQVNTS